MGQLCAKDDSASPSDAASSSKRKYEATDASPASGRARSATPPTVRDGDRTADFKKFKAIYAADGDAPLCAANGPSLGTFYVGGEDREVHYRSWRAKSIDEKNWKAHSGDINRMTYHSPDALLYTASRDKLIKCWKPEAATPAEMLRGTFEGHTLTVTGIALSPDGSRLVSGSRDNSTRLWDTETQSCLSVQDVKLNLVHWVLWLEEMGCVAQGGEDLTIRLWDVRTPNGDGLALQHVITNFDYHPICACPHQQNPYTIYTGHNGFNGRGSMVTEWDLRARGQVKSFVGAHTNTVRQVLHSSTLSGLSERPVVVSTSDDESLCLWEPVEGSLLKQYRLREGRVTSMVETPDHQLLLALRTGLVLATQFEAPLGNNEPPPRVLRTMQFGGD